MNDQQVGSICEPQFIPTADVRLTFILSSPQPDPFPASLEIDYVKFERRFPDISVSTKGTAATSWIIQSSVVIVSIFATIAVMGFVFFIVNDWHGGATNPKELRIATEMSLTDERRWITSTNQNSDTYMLWGIQDTVFSPKDPIPQVTAFQVIRYGTVQLDSPNS